MEFPYGNCERLLGCDGEGFVVIDGKKGLNAVQVGGGAAAPGRAVGKQAIMEGQNAVCEIIDKIGAASSKAQGLPAIITSASRLFTSDTRLYLRAEGNKVLGLLKVGIKKLFIRNETGTIKEISPLCVLDFYIHESVQRSG